MAGASQNIKAFPEVVHNAFEKSEDSAYIIEKGVEELWLKTDETKGYEHWIRLTPYDHNFTFPLNNEVIATPVIETQTRKDIRSKLQRLFGKKEEAGTVSLTRDLKQNGQWENFEVTSSPQNGLLLTSSKTELINVEALKNQFPHSQLVRAGIGYVLQLPRTEPIYSYEEVSNFDVQTSKKTKIIDRRDKCYSSNEHSPLTSELRTILNRYGEIVYESDPSHSDRVLICFKNIHGVWGDGEFLNAFKESAGDLYLRHQQNITDAFFEIVNRYGPDSVRAFIETAPASYEKFTDKDWRQYLPEFIWARYSYPSLHRDNLLQKLSKRFPLKQKELATLLSNQAIPRYNIENYCYENGLQNIISGDGRVERSEQEEQDRKDREMKAVSMKNSFGQVGIASEYVDKIINGEIKKGNNSHRVVTEQIAAKLSSGSIGFLVYGGMHFKSGIQFEEINHRHRVFEEYFCYLPQTQVVVVQEHYHKDLDEIYENRIRFTRSMSQTQFNIFEKNYFLARDITRELYFTLGKWHCAKEGLLKEILWEDVCEQVELYLDHVNTVKTFYETLCVTKDNR